MDGPDPRRPAPRRQVAANDRAGARAALVLGAGDAAGPLIRRVRQEQGLTLAELGDRCGYSASTMSRLERGHQPLRDIVVLASIAGALGIAPEALGLAPPARHTPAAAASSDRSGDPPVRVGAHHGAGGDDPVRRRELLAAAAGLAAAAALPTGLDSTAARAGAAGTRPALTTDLEHVLYGAGPAADPVPLPVLRRAVATARADFQAAGYRKVAIATPALIATATATRDATDGDNQLEAEALLASAYTVASNLMVKVDDDLMGLAAADRAVRAAERGHDPLTLADARRAVAVVLRRTGRATAAQDLLLRTAGAIDPAGDASAAQLSTYGALMSTAAYTAAVDGDRSAAHDLIGEAAAAAARLGGDANHRFTAFGPTNVVLYRLSIALVLGDTGAAVDHARTVRTAAIPTPERRGRYWVDLARAHHQWGKHPQCFRALLAAERVSAADVRYRPTVHRMTIDLLRADRRRELPGLPAFARRIGLPT